MVSGCGSTLTYSLLGTTAGGVVGGKGIVGGRGMLRGAVGGVVGGRGILIGTTGGVVGCKCVWLIGDILCGSVPDRGPPVGGVVGGIGPVYDLGKGGPLVCCKLRSGGLLAL